MQSYISLGIIQGPLLFAHLFVKTSILLFFFIKFFLKSFTWHVLSVCLLCQALVLFLIRMISIDG